MKKVSQRLLEEVKYQYESDDDFHTHARKMIDHGWSANPYITSSVPVEPLFTCIGHRIVPVMIYRREVKTHK